ncbi:MAG: lipopolysaccharide core heptose(I) kinase RfaP [Pseudomonadales bacterium]
MFQQKEFLRDDFAARWQGKDPFAEVDALTGTVFRHVARRKTFRFELDGRGYFAKVHHGVGWGEILKNWIVLKRPVIDASNEYYAATALAGADVDTLEVAAFAARGSNPAERRSFLITDELTGVRSLEDYCLNWPTQPPAAMVKWGLIAKIAEIARVMHGNGINHCDFYICHLMLRDPELLDVRTIGAVRLHLTDLHRARKRRRVPRRWLVKDLGGLYYSAMDIGLTQRDLLRFLACYFQCPAAEILAQRGSLLKDIARRARKLYAKADRLGILSRQLAAESRR